MIGGPEALININSCVLRLTCDWLLRPGCAAAFGMEFHGSFVVAPDHQRIEGSFSAAAGVTEHAPVRAHPCRHILAKVWTSHRVRGGADERDERCLRLASATGTALKQFP